MLGFCKSRMTPTDTHQADFWCSDRGHYVTHAQCKKCGNSKSEEMVITRTDGYDYNNLSEPVNRKQRRLAKRGKTWILDS
jgi:hypothetical protein